MDFAYSAWKTIVAALLLPLACGGPSDGTAGSSETGAETGSTSDTPTTTAESTADASTPADTTSDDSTGAGACVETQVATDDCCCFELLTPDDGGPQSLRNSCPTGETPCASISAKCQGTFGPDGSCVDDEFTVADSEAPAIACVLDALRAGAPAARLGWSITTTPGFAGQDTTVYITSAMDVIRTSNGYVDLSSEIGEVGRYDRPPAAFFDDCEAMPTPLAQFKCLKSFLDAAPASTCPLN